MNNIFACWLYKVAFMNSIYFEFWLEFTLFKINIRYHL